MGKGRQAPVVDKALASIDTSGDKGQDHFRDIVMAKNTQRKGNLEAQVGQKGEDGERPNKRAKMDE